MTMNILNKIERAHFLATEADIEAMARTRQEGEEFSARTGATYLKVLVALTARDIGGKTAHLSRRRGRAASGLTQEEITDHLATLEKVNASCYAAVARAVFTPEIAKKEGLEPAETTRRAIERNRRTNYARTALTAIRMYVNAGRDVRDLEPVAVTKESLREVAERYVPPPKAIAAGRLLRAATRASQRIISEAEQLATIDPEQAERLIFALMNELQSTLDKVRAGEIQVPRAPGQVEMGATTIVTNAVREAALRPRAREPAARAA